MEEFPVFGEDPDVEVGDEDEDSGAAVAFTDPDVVESAVVAEGDSACFVDAVFSDSEVGGDDEAWAGWSGWGSVVEGFEGGASAEGAVGADGVVVGGEGCQLVLEGCQGGGWFLAV